jgi:hypothetical protein
MDKLTVVWIVVVLTAALLVLNPGWFGLSYSGGSGAEGYSEAGGLALGDPSYQCAQDSDCEISEMGNKCIVNENICVTECMSDASCQSWETCTNYGATSIKACVPYYYTGT